MTTLRLGTIVRVAGNRFAIVSSVTANGRAQRLLFADKSTVAVEEAHVVEAMAHYEVEVQRVGPLFALRRYMDSGK